MGYKRGIAAFLAVIAAWQGAELFRANGALQGDLNNSGAVDKSDVQILQDFLLGQNVSFDPGLPDYNSDYTLNAVDLSLMKQGVIGGGTSPDPNPDPNPDPQPGNQSEYMAKVRENYVTDVPQDILNARGGELQHITYFSTKANKQKGAYVWLPPGYDPSQKYPVFYVNHGIQGSEYTMLGGFNIMESAAGLIEKGEAFPMIIVFTSMYTNPNKDECGGITPDEEPFYDAFLDDLTDSLMPYIESNYPCKTGRENTAIGGFSMGGRESLYIGIMRPDLFGYIAASSPAPGVVPAVDHFMMHPGSISEDQFRMSEPYLPCLLMIAGGTADGMVGDFPEQYHNLFTRNNTDHIWISVPGGGHDGTVGIPLFYNFIRALFKA